MHFLCRRSIFLIQVAIKKVLMVHSSRVIRFEVTADTNTGFLLVLYFPHVVHSHNLQTGHYILPTVNILKPGLHFIN